MCQPRCQPRAGTVQVRGRRAAGRGSGPRAAGRGPRRLEPPAPAARNQVRPAQEARRILVAGHGAQAFRKPRMGATQQTITGTRISVIPATEWSGRDCILALEPEPAATLPAPSETVTVAVARRFRQCASHCASLEQALFKITGHGPRARLEPPASWAAIAVAPGRPDTSEPQR